MDHNCLDHLQYHQSDAMEPHGERHTDEWWQCTVCGERYEEAELETEDDAGEDWD